MTVKFKDNHNNNRNVMVDFQGNKREKITRLPEYEKKYEKKRGKKPSKTLVNSKQ